ncbi:phage tail tape measure protein [Actinoplanes subtropicus]|uniref:phage tail tape measure protein n=1 Tax=Actinoplanes subtropicus TaxID=543632 RepID=UPI0004C3127E|nr:phage tail tape measure protein [Actinoplanes subtropicus]
MADAAGVAGIGLAGLAAGVVKMRMDFDKSMSAVQAATHAGAADIDKLRQAALQAGKDTSFSATQAADGITELAKAGVSTADVLGGGLKGALNLAAAGQLSVGEASETAASAMTQFKLSGKDVPHIADLLAAGAGKAQGSVHDMGYALSQSGLVASQFGLSIEDTTGTLAEFAHAGLIGSDAGTSLKTMLLALANPSKQSKALMDELGISFYDATGKFVGLGGVAQVLQTRLKGLTAEQRQQALGQLFGNDAIRAASILYTDGAAGVKEWKDSVNAAGYASSTAATMTNNLAGDIERLKGSIETLAIQSGGGAAGGLRVLTKATNGLVDQISLLPSGVTGTITVMAAAGGAALILGAGWVKLRAKTAEVRAELEAMGPAGVKAAAGLGKTAAIAGRAGAIFAGLEIAGASINSAFGTDVTAKTDAFGQSLSDWAKNGTEAGEAARIFGKDFGHLSYDLGTLGSGFWAKFGNSLAGTAENISGLGGVMDESLEHARQRLSQVDQSLTAMVQNGQGAQAAEIFNKLAAEGKKAGISVNDLKNGLPQYASASANAGTATKDTTNKLGDLNSALQVGADGQDKYKTAAAAAAGAARGERDAIGALFSMLKAETDPVFALIDAQKKLADAQKAYTGAVKAHGRNSAEAKAADLDLAKAALGLQNSVGDLSNQFNGKLDPAFVNTLRAAGLTKTQIADVAKQFEGAKKSADKYTGKYEGVVSAPGAVQSKKQIDDAYNAANHYAGPYQAYLSAPGAAKVQTQIDNAWKSLKGYDGDWVANLSTKNYGKVANDLRHLLAAQQALKDSTSVNEANRELGHFFSRGGPVIGPGTGTSDSIPARLSAGEFVIKASSVDKLGGALLAYMNRYGALPERSVDATPGFAAGGVVMPFPTNVSGTKIPQPAFSAPGGAGGPGYKWMEAVVRAAFPGIGIYSDFRPGAITITGNRSYHAVGRAVDFAPSLPLAEWINLHFMKATKELITPWQSLNIHNGARHTYSALVEAEHDFAHGNAHDHWAMKNGGVISEPIFGVGASGRTYSFGENYQPERVSPMWQTSAGGGGGVTNINLTVNAPLGSHPREIGAQVVQSIGDYLQGGGELRVNGQKVL